MTEERSKWILEVSADWKRFFPAGMTTTEVLASTKLTSDRLVSWARRNLLPIIYERPGRGKERLIPLADVKLLAMIRAVADAGVPIEQAVSLAQKFLGTFLGSNDNHALTNILTSPLPWDPILLFPDRHTGKYVTVDQFERQAPVADLWKFIRDRGDLNVIVFDFSYAFLDFWTRVALVAEVRESFPR